MIMSKDDLADLRRDFSGTRLLRSSVAPDPFDQFSIWMNEALDSDILDPNAMTVSTVGSDGKPSARVVLLKAFDKRGFEFFTNYESKKGRDLSANPNTVLHFFWPQLNRQVAICGIAEKISAEESKKYFDSRPLDSRIGAWASEQSTIIESRDVLEDRFAELKQRFAGSVPLPPFWGGFRVAPQKIEFWQGQPDRLHDRIIYELQNGEWKIFRLSP